MTTRALFLSIALVLAIAPGASAGRYIPGNAHRIGVRNAGMGGNHVAVQGDLSQALLNPAGILLDQNATLFSAEGAISSGPEFDTRGGRNQVESAIENPPLLMGFSTTYANDFAFAIFDALRYNAHFTGSLRSLDVDGLSILDFEEETRLNTTGLVAAVRAQKRRLIVGLGLYLDRQKVFKRADFARNEQVPYLDFEAFGSTNALHGAIGLQWFPKSSTSYALAFHTRSDLANNITQHTFLVGFADSSNSNSYFDPSEPVSKDAFPWSLALGMHHRLSTEKDLFADVAYVAWDVESNRNNMVSASVGGEWRVSPRTALRAGAYSQIDAFDESGAGGRSEEDDRLFDLRSPTASSYADKNNEIFLTGGVGFRFGAFTLDASLEDSHLMSDYGRTLVKAGLTGRLLNNQ